MTSEQGRTAGSFSRHVARFLCIDRDGETGFGTKGRDAASAPPVSTTPRDGQISDLQKMLPLPNRAQRRRRARISSEYYSSSDAYTPLYPSPMESVHTPVHSVEASRGRSRSEGVHPGARDANWLAEEEDRLEDGPAPDVPQGSGYVGAETGRARRRRRRYSSRITEISPPDIHAADAGEPRGSADEPPPTGRASSCSQETLVVERVDLAGTGSRKERRVLRRNSTGTVQIMEVWSSRSGQSASGRSGS